MNDITILYYTSNQEVEVFEKNIQKIILKHSNGLPIISVSQKDMDFGHNINVRQHKCCYFNEFRQIQIGLEQVKTKWVLVAESDFLYPPEYFSPVFYNDSQCYRYENIWVCDIRNEIGHRFRYKRFSDGAQCINRDLFLNRITKILNKYPMWIEDDRIFNFPDQSEIQIKTRDSWAWKGQPCITFKTEANCSKRTQIRKNEVPVYCLPLWGCSKSLIENLFDPDYVA